MDEYPKEAFLQTIQVTVSTLTPKNADLAKDIRSMLGPWCVSAVVTQLNEKCILTKGGVVCK